MEGWAGALLFWCISGLTAVWFALDEPAARDKSDRVVVVMLLVLTAIAGPAGLIAMSAMRLMDDRP